MGQFDREKKGRPTTTIKKDWEYQIYCGGKGGGGGLVQTGKYAYHFGVTNNEFAVRNLRRQIKNKSFNIYHSATYDSGLGRWVPVPGSEVRLRAWVFPQSIPTADESRADYNNGGILTPAVAPYIIDFAEDDLPQPGEPDYIPRMSEVYLFWGNPNYWWYGTPPADTFNNEKYDVEVVI